MSVGELQDRSVEAAGRSRAAPVIVMACAGSGTGRLRSVLSAFSELACSQGTGIVPLCHQAVSTWQLVDGGAAGGLAPLAASSVRALCSTLTTVILAREGGSRWCEFTIAPPAAAQTFARLYPQARFLIAYCRADTVMRAVIGASRWGLEGPEFVPAVSAYPANPVAALASYWATRTAQQLEFEQAHPGICHRVRMEDLTADAAQAVAGINDFLALGGTDPSLPYTHDDHQDPPSGGDLPLDRVPASLLSRVNELHRTLGYPPVPAAVARQGHVPPGSRP